MRHRLGAHDDAIAAGGRGEKSVELPAKVDAATVGESQRRDGSVDAHTEIRFVAHGSPLGSISRRGGRVRFPLTAAGNGDFCRSRKTALGVATVAILRGDG